MLGVLALTSCTKSFDVYFANPCPEEISVTTYSVPPERIESEPPSASTAIPPRGITKVGNAFFDAYGYSWAMVVEGIDHPLPVDGKALINETIVIPSEAC